MADKTLGSSAGLTILSEDQATPANGMVAYVTSSWNSGYQNGDIKLAALSDTDDTDLVGSGELVTNGEDWTGATGNTPPNGWTKAGDLTQYAITAGGALQIDRNGEGGTNTAQDITTVAGKTYVLSFDVVDDGGLNVAFQINGLSQYNSAGTGNKSVTFVATSSTTNIGVRPGSSPVQVIEIDNISVKLADEDRSVNNNGLIVNGTVSRDPVATGADLVSYSGFNASNYLEQPYNPDLDFGTGDFCVMGWVKTTDTSGCIIFRQDTAGSGGYLGLRISSSKLRFFAGTGLSGITDIDDDTWHFCVGVRRSGVMEVYVDGRLEISNAVSIDLDNASAVTRIGLEPDDTTALSPGSLALLRISATAPTAEQIKKIYEDEKVLFQENAQATLYGTSDAVTALAHDPVTDLLHVGTSDGRSVFQGLRRVDNTTDAVSTAISAHNGMVVDQ